MKILHVVPYLPKASGVTTFVVECSDRLQQQGCEQVVGNKDQVRFEAAPSAANVPRLGVAEALMKIDEFDIVHLHGIWPPFMHRFVVVARRQRVPIVWSLHGMLSPWAMKFKWWKKALPWLLWQKRDLKAAAILHVTSEKELDWVRVSGIKNRIVNIPLGTNLPEAVPVRRHEINTLLFVGRINYIKALDNLIRAWKLATPEGWKLRIVGLNEMNCQAGLEALARELHLDVSVEFPGPKFGADLEEEYRGADALVLPSHTENFGGVVVDALAWGLPVITSKGTPWREVEGEKEVVVGGGSGTVEERGGRGRDTRSTMEFGSPAISRRLLAEKKVDEWLRGVTRESFVSALGKLVEEKTSAREYRFRRPEERDLAVKGAVRFYDEFSRKIIPLSDGRCVYFTPDARSKVRNGNDLSRCWAEYAFHAVSSSGKMLEGRNYRERLYNSAKVSDAALIGEIICAERCMFRLIGDHPENDAVIFIGRDANGGRIEVVTRLDEYGNAQANLGEVTVIVQHARKKQTPPPKFRPLTEVVETVAKHQAAGFSPSTTIRNVPNPVVGVNSGGSDRVAEILSDGATGPSPLADAEHSTKGPVSGTIGNVEASCCRSRSACGWWVDNDPGTLAKALRELMALSDEERQTMGMRGRKLVRQKYSWTAVADQMKSVYDSFARGGC